MSGLVPGLGQVGHQLTKLLSAVVQQFRLLALRDLSNDLNPLDWSQDSSLKKKDSGFFIKYKNLSIFKTIIVFDVQVSGKLVRTICS